MPRPRVSVVLATLSSISLFIVTLGASQQVIAASNVILSVTLPENSSGTVTSSPSGINCPGTCNASFPAGTQVTLTETPNNSNFVGWGGACSGHSSTCAVTVNGNQQVSLTFNPADVTVLNHIIFLSQENRSFDHYFGALREYWAQNGYPDQKIDGLAQFNPGGQPPTNPGCNPNDTKSCEFDRQYRVTSYHLITQCIETPSPFWDNSHLDWDFYDRVGDRAATMNGFCLLGSLIRQVCEVL